MILLKIQKKWNGESELLVYDGKRAIAQYDFVEPASPAEIEAVRLTHGKSAQPAGVAA